MAQTFTKYQGLGNDFILVRRELVWQHNCLSVQSTAVLR